MSFGPSVGRWNDITTVPCQLFFPHRQFTHDDLTQLHERSRGGRGLVLHGDYRWTPANERLHDYTLSTLRQLLPPLRQLSVPVYLVVHFNSGSIENVAELVKRYTSTSTDNASVGQLALENMVGAGRQVGTSLDELRQFYEMLEPPYPSLCFDTQHAFAAGWLPNRRGYDDLFEFVDSYHLRLPVVHLNDSETEFGSRKDRHGGTWLGAGQLWVPERYDLLLDLIQYANDRRTMLIDEGADYKRSCRFLRQVVGQVNHSVRQSNGVLRDR